MKKMMMAVFFIVAAAVMVWLALTGTSGQWPGVDESVVERIAEEAGRPAREPYINTDQGDVLLFVFLTAGTVGGFIAGYQYRKLFGERGGKSQA